MTETSNNQPVITAQQLVRRFGHFVAVNNVDLAVNRGEVFGLLGANGAGKTTTLRMLCGTLPPSSGTVTVAGVDMVHHARRARGRIGYVTQRFALYGDLSVLENLDLQAGLYGMVGKHKQERLNWGLQHLQLNTDRNTKAGQLPLGYQRRLAIAAALLHEPDILFLDEPTSGLDPLARQQFWELIYELAESGIGILVTTHYMDEALFCDHLAMMEAGNIVARGTPAELLAHPIPTPILELRSRSCAECAGWLADWTEIREIIPHVGRLRLRLQPDTDQASLITRLQTMATQHGITIDAIEAVPPDLEDVFVAVLESAEQSAEETAA
jgi:ABC-2 type transport system ATP-binding protein